jgi:hypothetical protein
LTEHGIFEQGPRNVAVGLILIYLCAPLIITITFGSTDFTVQVIAPLWWIFSSQYVGDQVGPYPPQDTFFVQFNPMLVMVAIPLSLLQVFFIFMVYRYHLGETTKNRTLSIGILGAFQPSIIMFMSFLPIYIFMPTGSFPPILPISIPIVLVSGYFLMRIKKPIINEAWLEKPKPKW